MMPAVVDFCHQPLAAVGAEGHGRRAVTASV